MKKFILLIVVLLAGCAKNPYEDMSPKQLSHVSARQLCDAAYSWRYKKGPRTRSEILHRGYLGCSESALYCREDLGMKPGTSAYAICVMQSDQYELLKQMKKDLEWQAMKQDIDRENRQRELNELYR